MDKDEEVMVEIRELFNKLAWINKVKMEKSLKGYKPSEVHCIEYIAKNEDPNVTKLAEAFYMTKSAISKLTKKLMEKGFIESYQKPDNKKEIYFRLTSKGSAINQVHDELHQSFRNRDKVVFEHVTDEQYAAVLQFVDKYSKHLDNEIKKMGLNIKAE
ncbi:MarR family transcriptional regulator [Listeria ivanovii]|uniref:MarR family transcriptional regulator n=1 Tax=Listeria ivanovii subsp. londoniensis TaxID=202752 RepID=A0ABS1G3S0_LISIV|nr:MarR family transcriptional regulator [Listeria ivanovii]AIS59262.1 MarR family transcriptional regulator [Listeria ivanovii subsp. londoniensis]AIS62096.1 MarR family transcriptional regulator [Listeria ivanovii subsp. londoniensis]MBC2254923.1 MarR family transcriptional regulator [Listeria ivanovii]MBK1961523.1 MarR family transcriptional regulator [Listeria ivanovii subsp. londoniensis]MBK1965534.1 MarR family transcriptional regulator [Listeria ivanovii subsp. londoniensis]